MSVREWLAVAMFGAFIVGILSGFPVAWVLGGVAVLFTAIAIIVQQDFGHFTGVDWSYASIVTDRIWDLMDNWVLVALPMFICMGLFLDRAGIAADLMRDVWPPARASSAPRSFSSRYSAYHRCSRRVMHRPLPRGPSAPWEPWAS